MFLIKKVANMHYLKRFHQICLLLSAEMGGFLIFNLYFCSLFRCGWFFPALICSRTEAAAQ